MQLGKKVVVITGAARGLGRAMALAFAARGADIAAVDRDAQALEETVAQCVASGVRAHVDRARGGPDRVTEQRLHGAACCGIDLAGRAARRAYRRG